MLYYVHENKSANMLLKLKNLIISYFEIYFFRQYVHEDIFGG